DHPVVAARSLGDLLDPAAGEAVAREHLDRGAQAVIAGGLRGQLAAARTLRGAGGRALLRQGRRPGHGYCSAKARSMTKSPGVEVLPSLKPRASSICFRWRSMPGLPQIITRSSAGSSGGTPRSWNSLPDSISSVMRPMRWYCSRVTVG